jgi:methyltransferase-like protein
MAPNNIMNRLSRVKLCTGVENGRKQRIEEESWKQQLTQLYVVAQYTDFDLAHQNIVSTYFLLFNQAQFPQLLKMMKSYAGTTEV